MSIASITVHRVPLQLRAPFTTSFGTYETLDRPFVVIETSDGLRGVGEIPTLLDPAYKAEVDTPAVLTSLREFILPSVARAQREHGAIDDDRGAAGELRLDQRRGLRQERGRGRHLGHRSPSAPDEPLWRLWGGERRTFPVGVSIGGKTIEQVLELAEQRGRRSATAG